MAPFEFREFDKASGKLELVTEKRRQEIGRSLSPLTHADKGAAPTLIHHGDRDDVVPLTQSLERIDKFKKCGVECQLVARAGKGHMWFGFDKDIPAFADWFDRHLLGKK